MSFLHHVSSLFRLKVLPKVLADTITSYSSLDSAIATELGKRIVAELTAAYCGSETANLCHHMTKTTNLSIRIVRKLIAASGDASDSYATDPGRYHIGAADLRVQIVGQITATCRLGADFSENEAAAADLSVDV